MPIRDYKKSIIAFEGMLHDISEKRDLENQLLQAQKLGALGSLAGGIAHDFNNLIGGIMGCASLILANFPKDNPYYDDIKTILKASKKAADLSAQLLTFARQEKYNVRTMGINKTITECINLLSRTFNKAIQIKTHLSPDIVNIEGDPTRMQQAIMNICLNARDAMPNGGQITVETKDVTYNNNCVFWNAKLEPGRYVRIRIIDNGIGMNLDTMKRIFDPFFTTKPRGEGNGLGLATAMDIIKNHNGIITVQSKPGQGSTFEIYLPISDKPLDQDGTDHDPSNLVGGDENLLIVDDEEIIRRMGKRMLESFGYTVHLASNGPEAIRLYKKKYRSIDLLILDMVMPGMDGKSTLKQLKKINPAVKALLASGYNSPSKIKDFTSAGFCGYIKKPFLAREILNMIRKVLEDSRFNN